MIRPTPTELLDGIADTLRESVAVSLPAGEARNQVKAAAAILRRLATVWDRIVPSLEEENRDIEESLARLGRAVEQVAPETLGASEADIADTPFARAARRNELLQEQLRVIHEALAECEDFELKTGIETKLRQLYRRNLERDRGLAGRG